MQASSRLSQADNSAPHSSSCSAVGEKPRANELSRPLLILLMLLVVASFAIRIAAWAYCGTGTIESEGAEYAKIAQNLRHGFGYVGLVSAGPQVLFNPLFPYLIAGVSFFTHDYELAGRLVALVLGSLLPLPAFGIASRLFNRRVGFIAAALVLLHPLSVYLSFMVYSEGPYATLLLSAIYLVVRALDDRSLKRWFLVGGAFGVCYLLRAEAFAAFAISVAFPFIATYGDRRVKLKQAAFAIVVFVAFALPEIIFLDRSTGKLLLEGKSTILFSYTGRRILAAERHPGANFVSDGGRLEVPSPVPDVEGGYPEKWEGKWAFYGIDPQLSETGTAMRPFAGIVRETHIRIKDLIPLVAKGIRLNLPELYRNFSAGWLGAPLLPALAFLGAFRRPWRGPQATTRLLVMLLTAVPSLATLFVLWGDPRYFFIFVPLLCIWAANGVFEFGRWIRASIAGTRWNALSHSAFVQWCFPALLVIAMVYGSAKQVGKQFEFSDSASPARINKDLGLWIGRQQDRPIRIMDLSLPLSYHASAQQHVYFPYCTGDVALRYLDAAQVDYIVLRRDKKFTKYYEIWLTSGIPNRRAELVQLPPMAGADEFIIYRLHRIGDVEIPGSASAKSP